MNDSVLKGKVSFHITMFWIWGSVGSVLGVFKKTLNVKFSSSENTQY